MKILNYIPLLLYPCWIFGQSFENVTVASGLVAEHSANKMSTGIAVADFDNNGYPDLFLTGYALNSQLYFNDGAGNFAINPSWQMPDLTGANCGSVAAADFDNNGTQDLYVACLGANYLLKNTGSSFTNIITLAGVNHAERTEAVAWGDLNQDGLLDLVLVVYPLSFPPNVNDPDNLDQIFINNGDTTFTAVSSNISLSQLSKATLAVSLTDIDFDGDLDIYMLNDKYHGNVLLLNDGQGCGGMCFSDISTTSGAERPADSMGIAVADYDLDGDWDMSYSSINEQVFLKNESVSTIPSFNDQAVSISPFSLSASGWGTLMFDAQNNGYEDLFIATQYGYPKFISNLLFINQQNGQFLDGSTDAGVFDTEGSQAAVWLDYNLDGKLDVAYGRYNQFYQLLQNTTQNANNWIGFKLKATKDINHDAIGTKIKLTLSDGNILIRELRAGESRGSNNHKIIHFGMGSNEFQNVELIWPNQEIYTFDTLEINTYHDITYTGPDFLFSTGFE